MTYLSEVESALANAHREERHLREVNEYLEGELREAKQRISTLTVEIQHLRRLIPRPDQSGIQSGGEVAS